MARLLSARGVAGTSGMRLRSQKSARTQCYDDSGTAIMCPLDVVEENDTLPDAHDVFSRTAQTTEQGEPTDTADTSSGGELGSNASTRTDAITSSMAKTTMVATSSPTATDTDSSLSPVGIIEAPGNDSGLSSGAVAGIAIGTLVIGAVLAFVAAFLIFKRRNKQTEGDIRGTGYRSYGDSAPELDMVQKSVGSLGDAHSPYVQVSQTPMIARRSVPPPAIPVAAAMESTSHTDVAGFLPPPALDDQVCERVSGLFEKMHEHIERNYRDVHASITPSMEAGIASFGARGVDMTELLRECSSPTTALKHALVVYVLSITGSQTQGGDAGTLFPEELSRARAGSRNSSSDSNVVAAASLLRRVSVYLYATTSGTHESRQSWMAQSSAREAAEHFSLTFFPWANPTSSDQQRDEELTFIIMEALEISIWLFGQPDRYGFQWEGAGRGGVLVSPGLVKHTVTHGEEQDTIVVEGAVVGM